MTWYPSIINDMIFYADPPSTGVVDLKLEYKGKILTKEFQRFKIFLFSNNRLWCQYEMIHAGFEIDAERLTLTDYYNFLERKKYVPGCSIAKEYKNGFKISNLEWRKQNWPLGNNSYVYKLADNSEE